MVAPRGFSSNTLTARRIICVAMAFSALLYAGLGWFMITNMVAVPEGAVPGAVLYVLVGVALGMLLAGSWLSLRAGASSEEAPAGTDQVSRTVVGLFRAGLIAMVVLEGSALVFAVAAVASRQPEMLAGPVVCAGMILRMWPRGNGS